MARKRGKAIVRLSVVTLVGSRRISQPLIAEVEVPPDSEVVNVTEATFAIIRKGLACLSEECEAQYEKYIEGGILAWDENEQRKQGKSRKEKPTSTSGRKKKKARR